jgi:hypothetical protein
MNETMGSCYYNKSWTEFFCPYCQLWITDLVHRQFHHNDSDKPDERRDWRERRVTVDGKGLKTVAAIEDEEDA